ncbi:hypothetical protein [Conexibacter arvalis]|uniref:Metalloenzyme domain-containing protein n=1 Tax=Conexibacter arvalis TaxID=912552 RepID=A0A840IFZ5_9ACTN|nr:hypothetical protein [Conexibacter arvalis]MBB4663739.1 hypothetical protein [Conexibacter arvalis]
MAPTVLVILDGASEPVRPGLPTCLEHAATPALDALCAEGVVTRVRTVAPWLAPGSESAIPALLGWIPPAPVDRGMVEAVAWEIPLDAGCGERAAAIVAGAPTGRERAAAGAAGGGERAAAVAAGAAAGGERACARSVRAAAGGERARPASAVEARGEWAWRVDVRAEDGSRADVGAVRAAVDTLDFALPDHRVVPLAGHRLLVVGRPPLPPLDGAAAPHAVAARTGEVAASGGAAAASEPAAGTGAVAGKAAEGALAGRHALDVWPEGVVPPRLLDARTVVVAARGAAAGIARLMGARVVVPDGATGRPGSDLAAKTAAALDALAAGAKQVVVHVGGPDEAAHERDAAAKVAAIEAADRDVIAPLRTAVASAGGTLRICPDHGCDPADGRHDAAPVPRVEWTGGLLAEASGRLDGIGRAPTTSAGGTVADRGHARPTRLTERAVAGLPIVELEPSARAAA